MMARGWSCAFPWQSCHVNKCVGSVRMIFSTILEYHVLHNEKFAMEWSTQGVFL